LPREHLSPFAPWLRLMISCCYYVCTHKALLQRGKSDRRVLFLLDEFATSFEAADRVIVPEIYFVRDSEQEREAVTAEDLVARLTTAGTDAEYAPTFDGIVGRLLKTAGPGDLVVTMGAGDIHRAARQYRDA
ncbi:MAG: hypothetical protein R3336_06015, partial [Phycisphaeraceae bacterium]|nr:hypothetical protein [Phycisphaeraceae bacterium]